MRAGLILVAVGALFARTAEADEAAGPHWPQWRGPLGTGEAPDADPPVEWSEIKNIRWKAALPGLGHSTPVVWGDRIFLTTAVPYGARVEPKPETAPGAHDNLPVKHHHKYLVLAVDRRTGKILWEREVHRDLPHEGGHTTGSLASASPVTDGERVIAFFGSRGLTCLNLDGEVQWKTDLGDMRTKHAHGEGASPVLHGGTLVVPWDHEGKSFVVAFDAKTGKERWKAMRDEVTSWATPIVVEHDGKPQVVVSATNRVRAYDLATGRVVWECGGLSHNVVASPVAANGIVIAGSSYEKRAMVAVKLDGAAGDVTGTGQVLWTRRQRTPYVPSPLLYGDVLYYHAHYQAVLSRVNAKTGEDQPGAFRLDGIGNVYASAVGAAGRVYITDLSGTTVVFTHADEPKVLAMNHLKDSFSASAAIVGKELFLRGQKTLYCISEKH